jgi:flagellar hook-basal body complex protein FliE
MSGLISGLGAIGTISPLQKGSPIEPANTEGGFSGILSDALQKVSQVNNSADQQIGNLLNGGNTDISTVMIAVEKADVAFQLMMQVRNKIVSAYDEIEKMQF